MQNKRENESYNLILLGGTGAKCGEIFVHMCANGYFDCDEINILYIDSDRENGNAKNFERVVELYKKCREQYRIAKSPLYYFFKPEIHFYEKTPVPDKINQFKDIAGDGGNALEAQMLMEVLYSEEEMEMMVGKGFFAHPNVGAAVFASNLETILFEFLQQIEQDNKDMKKIKIFLLGSIFGGTGAASFPTLAKYFRETLYGKSSNKYISERLKIGGCMVLPYFLFSRKRVDNRMNETEVDVEADKFATKTRSALEYYQYVDEKSEQSLFDGLYIVGHDGNDVRGYHALAGNKQKNLPHVVELYAAMSVVSFFESSFEKKGYYFATVPKKIIGWSDIDKKGDGYFAFFVMTRFAIVMKSLILEELFDYKQKKRLQTHAKRIPWYYDFLDGKSKSEDMDSQKLYSRFEAISAYCEEYIRWFAQLNIANIDKIEQLNEINYAEDSGDLVEYLSMFTKELLLRQYENDQIWNDMDQYENREIQKRYSENLKYIRENLQNLEKIHEYTDLKTEQIGMEEIWRRISDSGFDSFTRQNEMFKNIKQSNDKSMEAGVRNLINAVYCACLI